MRRQRDARTGGSQSHHIRYTAADYQSAMHGPDPRMEELAYLRSLLGPVEALILQRQPLIGTVYTEQGPMDVAEALVVFDVDNIVYRFGTWVVTEDGIACLVHHYPLTSARLHEQQDWASHLAEQGWVNLWDLLRALAVEAHIPKGGPQEGSQGDPAQPG